MWRWMVPTETHYPGQWTWSKNELYLLVINYNIIVCTYQILNLWESNILILLYYRVYLLLYLWCNDSSRCSRMTVSPGTSFEIDAWLNHCGRTSLSTISHRAPPVRRVACCFLKEIYNIINFKSIAISYGVKGFITFLNFLYLHCVREPVCVQ